MMRKFMLEAALVQANTLFRLLEENRDPERAKQMSAYMRDQFLF